MINHFLVVWDFDMEIKVTFKKVAYQFIKSFQYFVVHVCFQFVHAFEMHYGTLISASTIFDVEKLNKVNFLSHF